MEDGTDRSICHTSIMVDEEDDDASVDDGEDVDIVLEASKNPKTAKLPRCIFKVPEVLRRHNLKAYEPDVVSIGPFHHPKDHKQFQLMEDMKQRYLLELLSCMGVVNLKTLVKDVIEFSDQESEGILGYEERARLFYAEPLDDYNHNEFIEMIIRDGCFIVQLFRKHYNKKLRDTNDPIFTMDCMFQYICHDLLLLENQIPWFVLKSVYSFTEEKYHYGGFSLLELILTVLSSQRQLRDYCGSYLDAYEEGKEDKSQNTILHILDLIRTSIVFSLEPYPFENKKPYHDSNIQLINSATALSEAGIKLKMTGKKNYIGGKHKTLKMFPQACKSIMNIKFEKGVLTIPHLAVGEMTESLFRNLIALEQCCHGRSHKITSYAVLMDNLIGSKKDMEFLSEKKIIGNWLSAEDGYQFFNKLHNDTVLSKFYYGGLCAEVKTYQVNWRRYREVFKRNYCSDPWKATSWFAACVLLFLTVVQTAYTLKQYYSPA